MKLTSLSCGPLGSVDRAAFSPGGKYMAVAAAPMSSLKVFDVPGGRWLRGVPKVSEVLAVAASDRGVYEQVIFHKHRSAQLQRWSPAGGNLDPIEIPGYSDVVLAISGDGSQLAYGDSYGNISVYALDSLEPHRQFTRSLGDEACYALAFNHDASALYASFAGGGLLKVDLFGEQCQWLHNKQAKWYCFSIATHAQSPETVAFGGDGSRVWLLDLPFALPDDLENCGNGFPMAGWQLDAGDFAGKFSLRKRVWVPGVEPERCAYIDTDVGEHISHLALTADWQLLVVGDMGYEVWSLKPLKLVDSKAWRSLPTRRVFASCRQTGGLLLAQEIG